LTTDEMKAKQKECDDVFMPVFTKFHGTESDPSAPQAMPKDELD
jgi:hypothetical protein